MDWLLAKLHIPYLKWGDKYTIGMDCTVYTVYSPNYGSHQFMDLTETSLMSALSMRTPANTPQHNMIKTHFARHNNRPLQHALDFNSSSLYAP
jgi:hypothetical protein